MEFVISDESTQNNAVVLPLTRNANGTVMAGITTEYLPAPQRLQGNGLTVRAPSFDLPKEIVNMHQARKFVADKFGVPVENVFKLGESYFCHPGITPQRVFPFAVAAHRMAPKLLGGIVEFIPLRKFYNVLFRIMDWNLDLSTAYAFTKAGRYLGDSNDMGLQLDVGRNEMYSMLEPGSEKFEDMTGLVAPRATPVAATPAIDDVPVAFAGGRSRPNSSSDGGEESGSAEQASGEPAFINAREEFVQKQQANSTSRTRSGSSSGGSGSVRPKQRQAEAASSKEQEAPRTIQAAAQQGQIPEIEEAVNFRSEPMFDSGVEEFIENFSNRMPDRLDQKNLMVSKSGK